MEANHFHTSQTEFKLERHSQNIMHIIKMSNTTEFGDSLSGPHLFLSERKDTKLLQGPFGSKYNSRLKKVVKAGPTLEDWYGIIFLIYKKEKS